MDKAHALTERQIKAARALLDWSQDDLASSSGLSVATIRKIELGHISPRDKTAHDIRQAFENAGLEFIEPGGVRQKPEDITVYHGSEGARAFFDDVYETAQKKGSEIVQVWPSSRPFLEAIGTYKDIHYERMNKLAHAISVKAITTKGWDPDLVAPYCESRSISENYVNSVPFYVYDDKYAIIITTANPSPKIIVIQSPIVAEAYRLQFYSMWDKATPISKAGSSGGQIKKKA